MSDRSPYEPIGFLAGDPDRHGRERELEARVERLQSELAAAMAELANVQSLLSDEKAIHHRAMEALAAANERAEKAVVDERRTLREMLGYVGPDGPGRGVISALLERLNSREDLRSTPEAPIQDTRRTVEPQLHDATCMCEACMPTPAEPAPSVLDRGIATAGVTSVGSEPTPAQEPKPLPPPVRHARSAADPEAEWDDSTRVCTGCGDPWPCVFAREESAHQPGMTQGAPKPRTPEEIAARQAKALAALFDLSESQEQDLLYAFRRWLDSRKDQA